MVVLDYTKCHPLVVCTKPPVQLRLVAFRCVNLPGIRAEVSYDHNGIVYGLTLFGNAFTADLFRHEDRFYMSTLDDVIVRDDCIVHRARFLQALHSEQTASGERYILREGELPSFARDIFNAGTKRRVSRLLKHRLPAPAA